LSELLNSLTFVLVAGGAVFIIAGTVGLLRFPDVHTRLHAVTKADNLGLGMIALGLAVQADTIWAAGKFILVWLLIMLATATASQLIARTVLAADVRRSTES